MDLNIKVDFQGPLFGEKVIFDANYFGIGPLVSCIHRKKEYLVDSSRSKKDSGLFLENASTPLTTISVTVIIISEADITDSDNGILNDTTLTLETDQA